MSFSSDSKNLSHEIRHYMGIHWKMLAALFIVFVAIVLLVISISFRKTDVYKHALGLAIANSKVTTILGSPINPGFFTSGKMKLSSTSSSAELNIPISGPQRNGNIYVKAIKNGSSPNWQYLEIVFHSNNASESINLLE